MSTKRFFQLFLSFFSILIIASCSQDKDSSDIQSFDDFDISNYIDESSYGDFSFSKVLSYVIHINKIDDYSINSLAFSIVDEKIDSFSISISDKQNTRVLSAIYRDGIFRNRMDELDPDSPDFDTSLVEIVDTLLQLDDFKDLSVSEVYFLSELSSSNVDLSYLSNYDFFSLDDGRLKTLRDSELGTLDPTLVFSIYVDDNSSPKYITVE